MGTRTIRRRDSGARRKQETLTLWKILAVLTVPLVITCILMARDIRSDLSALTPTETTGSASPVWIGWPDLKLRYARSTLDASGIVESTRQVRMIGYMMDGYRPSRDGSQTDIFVLLPEAGQFLHPAHRTPNQMVEVHPRHTVLFRYRDLVWVSGMLKLNRTIGNSGGEMAAYAMSGAEVNSATEQDIRDWFSFPSVAAAPGQK
jgi:hypothetical protein